MSFVLNKPLPDEELHRRNQELILNVGLSQTVVNRLRQITPNLCDVDKAKRRIENLKDLGFDVDYFVECNPKILDRRCDTVRNKFCIVQRWFRVLRVQDDIYHVLTMRPQLWSVSPKKFHIICLLARNMSGITAGRICNMCALNIEDILYAYCSTTSKSA